MIYVYVLKSKKDGNLYIGHSKDVKKRLKMHNKGKVKSTKSRRPFELLGTKSFKTRSEARWLEYQVKNHSDKKYKLLRELGVLKTKSEAG